MEIKAPGRVVTGRVKYSSIPPITKINVPLIKRRLQEMMDNTFEYAEDFPSWIYGLATYSHVCRRLSGEINPGRAVNGSIFAALHDHKTMMLTRLQILQDFGIQIPPEVISAYLSMALTTERLKTIYAKYRLSPTHELRGSLITSIQYIKEQEKNILPKLITAL